MMSMMKIMQFPYLYLLPTVTESQPTVTTFSTPYNWSAIPLADEIKALKIENHILKDKIKASKRPIKVLVQRHDKFKWQTIKTDAKVRFYTRIATVDLLNAISH